MRFSTKLLPSRSGNLGICLLNNPKAFHALSLEMILVLQDVLDNWYNGRNDTGSNDDCLQAILFKSNPENLKRPAFCAGGDVKSIYMSILQSDDEMNNSSRQRYGQGKPGLLSADFFRHEYRVNHALATVQESAYTLSTTTTTNSNDNSNSDQQHQQSQQPVQISLWDGIVMGGGVGISIHGKYRIATENSILAMPETAIGFFPDVGSLYWMPRLLSPGNAVYLALTGQRLHAPDLLYTGLATHYIPSNRLHDLETALIQATATAASGGGGGGGGGVAPVLSSFHQAPPKDPAQSMLARQKSNIDAVFGPALQDDSYRVEHIVASLEKMKKKHDDSDDFSSKTLATLEKMSPTSLQVTLEGLRRGSKCCSIGQDLVMEFRMSQHFMRPGSDFMEGIRAMLVDKGDDTKPPLWHPARLEDVTDEMIASYFGPIEHEWEIPKTTSSSRL